MNAHVENDAADQHEEQAGRGKADMLSLQKELRVSTRSTAIEKAMTHGRSR